MKTLTWPALLFWPLLVAAQSPATPLTPPIPSASSLYADITLQTVEPHIAVAELENSSVSAAAATVSGNAARPQPAASRAAMALLGIGGVAFVAVYAL